MRHGKQTEELLLDAFMYYMGLERAERREKVGMFERLVCCWQDQGLSFKKLEAFLLGSKDPGLLNIIIITLFCPQSEDKLSANGVDSPNKRYFFYFYLTCRKFMLSTKRFQYIDGDTASRPL